MEVCGDPVFFYRLAQLEEESYLITCTRTSQWEKQETVAYKVRLEAPSWGTSSRWVCTFSRWKGGGLGWGKRRPPRCGAVDTYHRLVSFTEQLAVSSLVPLEWYPSEFSISQFWWIYPLNSNRL